MQIEGITGLLRIYTCELHKEEGQHSHLSFTALVEDGSGARYLQQVKKPVKVYWTSASGEKEDCLFCGLIDSIQLEESFTATKIRVCASSYSILLDQKEHQRIFQNEKKTLKEVLSKERLALDKEMNGGVVQLEIASPLLNCSYPPIIVQNRETNFAFLKRCSRALHSPFWVRDRKENLTLKMDSQTSNHILDIPENDVRYWRSCRDFSGETSEVELKRYVELGFVVTFPKITKDKYLVVASSVIYENGRDICRARLQKVSKEKAAAGTPEFRQEAPLRLLATVTNTEDPQHLGRLQVHFTGNRPEYEDLDVKKPAWIPYRSPYTGTKDGIVFLPDKGDTVEVVLLQGEGYLATAFRQQSLDEEAGRVADKYIGNNFERRILWKEKSLELLSGKNRIILDDEKIELQVGDTQVRLDKEGLHLQVQKGKTTLNITGDMILQSKGELQFASKETKIKSTGEIKLDSSKDMHLKGRKIKLE